jgi:hypothetical protein
MRAPKRNPAGLRRGSLQRRCAARFRVARLTGLEPATPGVTGRYSNQLSYNRSLKGAGFPACRRVYCAGARSSSGLAHQFPVFSPPTGRGPYPRRIGRAEASARSRARSRAKTQSPAAAISAVPVQTAGRGTSPKISQPQKIASGSATYS